MAFGTIEGKDINYDKCVKIARDFCDNKIRTGRTVSMTITARDGKVTGKEFKICDEA